MKIIDEKNINIRINNKKREKNKKERKQFDYKTCEMHFVVVVVLFDKWCA